MQRNALLLIPDEQIAKISNVIIEENILKPFIDFLNMLVDIPDATNVIAQNVIVDKDGILTLNVSEDITGRLFFPKFSICLPKNKNHSLEKYTYIKTYEDEKDKAKLQENKFIEVIPVKMMNRNLFSDRFLQLLTEIYINLPTKTIVSEKITAAENQARELEKMGKMLEKLNEILVIVLAEIKAWQDLRTKLKVLITDEEVRNLEQIFLNSIAYFLYSLPKEQYDIQFIAMMKDREKEMELAKQHEKQKKKKKENKKEKKQENKQENKQEKKQENKQENRDVSASEKKSAKKPRPTLSLSALGKRTSQTRLPKYVKKTSPRIEDSPSNVYVNPNYRGPAQLTPRTSFDSSVEQSPRKKAESTTSNNVYFNPNFKEPGYLTSSSSPSFEKFFGPNADSSSGTVSTSNTPQGSPRVDESKTLRQSSPRFNEGRAAQYSPRVTVTSVSIHQPKQEKDIKKPCNDKAAAESEFGYSYK